ncbi:hypothetical protein BT96DRAFT_1018012 [Gymnopus androsaceus JB14]|uniref:Uncharacterized protein n=1 Tax=Gymnopus androsaceus JB14 TaxID=1447944 RepID=A0A6A4HUE8_9AGAR|nr:hypothetical protein BT96DRAFT_1018012 [Gymnopus androsaceus JB14]
MPTSQLHKSPQGPTSSSNVGSKKGGDEASPKMARFDSKETTCIVDQKFECGSSFNAHSHQSVCPYDWSFQARSRS